jgi:sec-independent protein translocase protein TatC
MSLIFAFGLVFQLPVISSLLVRAGFIDAKALAKKRKYAIVISFVVAAVLTPPDPVSQIGLALPAILLYEISIYTARLIERQRANPSDAQDVENEVVATQGEAD